ncbi:hypothetical protein [Mycobacterium sp.]|uniref:hypothetical protein n=1 Tax=Mycobacterium sp. TaxID=1785 RepID=UPI0025D3924A|nr:hypothetical protein [Mycobacterium sp.]MBW0015646.1 hypothetical protein [Mycobacterium sp.]
MSTVDPQSAIPDALAALDWHMITCQSEARCTNQATHVVYRHAVDECNRPNLDPSGNIVDILCISCVRSLKAQLLQQVDRIARCPGGNCLTCGAPVHKLSDIMRRVVQLRIYA